MTPSPAPSASIGPALWSSPASQLIELLGSDAATGLTPEVAAERLRQLGPNRIGTGVRASTLRLFARQFTSPLVLILLFGAGVSATLGEWVDASIIVAIVLGSGLLSFFQEHRASQAMASLRQRLALTARVVRTGTEQMLPVEALVPGDVVLLSAGNLVPGDGRVLEANDFLVTEAALTGESLPVEKRPGVTAEASGVGERTNCVFMGASVRSGTARVLIAETGQRTLFGSIAKRLEQAEGETDFARGVQRFGAMLLRVMVVIVLAVLTVNQLLGRPIAESLLFAVALAVGLSPELLPAIVSVSLAAGARHLAARGVIVRRLEAIENLGSMDVLCTDKTGTITEGTVSLHAALDADGAPSEPVRDAAFLNAAFESGIANPLDAALVAAAQAAGWSAGAARKIDEIPYDFQRRRLSIVVADPDDASEQRLITKGAFSDVMAICCRVRDGDGNRPLDAEARARIEAIFSAQSQAGFRVLAVAERRMPPEVQWSRDDERDMTFLGLLLFADPPKPEVAETIRALCRLGIAVKLISGDNRHVTAFVASHVGLDARSMLTGGEIAAMTEAALRHRAAHTSLFVEIDPEQKQRIVRALQHRGHSVGFLGDGINDAPALRAADVGISVDQAVDVARESADVVLLRRDLDVLRQGVTDGRRTFANTLKYIAITTSANFGNMVSMAIATPLLPFLPLLPKQILLNNFLSDLPSIAISGDRVDAKQLTRPQRWQVRDIERFMIVFGLISSCFDLLTFGVLLWLLHADATAFHTSWFLVSLLTELAVLLVLRTRGPALASRPSRTLLWATLAVGLLALALPFIQPVARLFGFVPVSVGALAIVLAITAAYAAATEAAKRAFFRQHRRSARHGRRNRS